MIFFQQIFTSLADLNFWFYIPVFLLAIFIAFFVPADLLLRKLQLSFFYRFTIGLVLGMVLWAWQGFIFGYLNLRWFSYVYLMVCFIFWIKTFKLSILKIKKPHLSPEKILLTSMILIGVFIQISIVWFTGMFYNNGYYFCCGAISDNIYHLGIVHQIIQKIPPFEPGMYGVEIRNYHYWGHLVVAELVRIFHLPLFYTQFRYMAIFISVFLGLLAITFSKILKLKTLYLFLLIFLLYFGGDFVYLIILSLGHGLQFSTGPLENGASFLGNFPRSYAVIVFFAGLSLLSIWIKKRDLYTGLLATFLLGSSIGFKVYIGIFALSGMFFLALFYLVAKKWKMLIPCIFILIISLAVYLPANKASGSLFFTGFWQFENFIVQPAFNLSHLELARELYVAHHNYIHAFINDLLFMLLFFFGTFGVKNLGFFQDRKTLSFFPKELNIFLISAILISLISGSFFQQESGGSNSFNFFVSVYIIGSIYTALVCFYWLKSPHFIIKIIVVGLILLGTLPRVIYEGTQNINSIINTKINIDSKQIQAYQYIKNNLPKSTLFLVSPQTQYYVFMADKSVFLGDYGILESHTINTSSRKKIIDTILTNPNPNIVYNTIVKNKITHLFLPSSFALISTNSAKFLKTIFDNKEIKILEVVKRNGDGLNQ